MKSLLKTLLLIVISTPFALAQNDWENPKVFERNQTEAHAPLTPYTSVNEALMGNREANAYYQSLNATWKFNWVSKVDEASEDFYKSESKVKNWVDIEVPSNWQMKGYGHPMFRNVTMEFPEKAPNVPEYYNPVGSYFRTFEVPKNWKGRQIFLHFEGVKSASYVWVNGKEVGYNQGGFEPAEYDVTDFVKPGKNTVAVKVLRYSDGSFLENQDMWRLSGIYRNVYLFAAPELHMRDYFFFTDFDENYENALFSLEVEVSNFTEEKKNATLQINLWDGKKKVKLSNASRQSFSVDPGKVQKVFIGDKVIKPKQWSAEKPNLYTLTLELLDENGKVIEAYAPKVGFRETEVKGNAIYVNGMPIKFNGVNSHVHHPETGKVMDEATIRKDFELMKQFNINLVRTSHYPPNIEYLQLANEYGIYVVDETGDECHGNIYLSGEPEWKEMFIDRARKIVKRDRNNPSLVFWSGGNEAGVGDNLKAMMEAGRKLDPSRPNWMYGGNTFEIPFEDIIGPRYWRPYRIKQLAEQDPAEDSRPSFMDEYLAATGNSMGGLDDYWELIRKYPRLTGGAIWDWVSPSIKHPLMILKDASPARNNGAIMGRADLVDGKFGKALDLSGHDEWVEFYRDPSLDITDEITMDLWVKPRTFIHTNYFLSKGNHAYGLIQKDAETIEFFIHGEERQSATCPVPSNWVNEWHQLIGVFDGKNMKLYMDGELKTTHPYTGKIMNSPFPVTIGRDSENHGPETQGMLGNAIIDQVRIFNKAIYLNELSGQKKSDAVLWMDFESVEENGHFYMTGLEGRTYGLVWADRGIQPEMYQVKKSAQPVVVSNPRLSKTPNGIVLTAKFFNYFNFTDLNELDIKYSIGAVDAPLNNSIKVDLAPHDQDNVILDAKGIDFKAAEDIWLNIAFYTKNSSLGLPAGHEVAWEQLQLKKAQPSIWADPEIAHIEHDEKPLKFISSGFKSTVRGENFEYTFNNTSAGLEKMIYGGKVILENGPLFNVWRAPIANDIDPWNNWQHNSQVKIDGLGRSRDNHWRTIGIDQLEYTFDGVSYESVAGSEELKLIFQQTATTSTREGAFQNQYIYTINKEGAIRLDVKTTAKGKMPQWLPKVGLQFQLPSELQNVQYTGRGPYENYPDRKSGYKLGTYKTTIKDIYVPYLIPQDHGNRCDVSSLKLTDESGAGIHVESNGDLFNFSAHEYSTDNLERAMYPFQLRKADKVFLNIDHKVNGLGDTSLATLQQHRVLPGTYEFSIVIKPVE